MQIQFLGAARQVTGSQYCLTVEGRNVLIDCGMFQERAFLDRNWSQGPIRPKDIDAVLITHAHIDHCGLLPKLVHEGFKGPIYTTPASADLIEIVLHDAAKIQAEDAHFKARRHHKEGRRAPHPVKPLFTDRDVHRTIPMLREVDYNCPVELLGGKKSKKSPRTPLRQLMATFHDAGHILGSAMVELTYTGNSSSEGDNTGTSRRIVFSGDIGQGDRPIIRDPSVLTHADYLVMESTYGDREHGNRNGEVAEGTGEQLTRLINETHKQGGNVVIPTFAIERAQELIYQIGQLINQGKIPHMPVYLDSPMAGRVTTVFRKHRDLFDAEAWQRIDAGDCPLRFPELKIVTSAEESKAINHENQPCIIMSTSGMCTGGRIKHHLVHNIMRPESMILFVGYQAVGTLGRQIVQGNREVRIHNRRWPVRARVEQVHGFSGHADRNMLVDWLANLKVAPRQLFLTHGDREASLGLADDLRKRLGWEMTENGGPICIPEYQQTVELL